MTWSGLNQTSMLSLDRVSFKSHHMYDILTKYIYVWVTFVLYYMHDIESRAFVYAFLSNARKSTFHRTRVIILQPY